MQKPKQIGKWIPELYLLASALFYWISTSTLFNPFAIFLVAMLLALFKWKVKILGVITSLMFLILSLYMVLALLSDLGEFRTFSTNDRLLVAVAGSWLGANIILASLMLYKWGKLQTLSNDAEKSKEALFS